MRQDRPDQDSPAASEGAYSTGVTFMKRQAWDEAAAWLQRAAEWEPTNLAVHLDWGEALARSQRYREAAAVYRRMASICSDSIEKSLCLYLLGGTLLRVGEFTEALQQLEEALVLRPAFVEALGLHGVVLERLGRNAPAREVFDRVLAVCPQYFERWPVSFEGAFLMSLPELRESYARAGKPA